MDLGKKIVKLRERKIVMEEERYSEGENRPKEKVARSRKPKTKDKTNFKWKTSRYTQVKTAQLEYHRDDPCLTAAFDKHVPACVNSGWRSAFVLGTVTGGAARGDRLPA